MKIKQINASSFSSRNKKQQFQKGGQNSIYSRKLKNIVNN